MHDRPSVSFGAYLLSDHFLEATFENWESEFLQMAAYVVLTAVLYQRGSAESKDPDKEDKEPPATAKSPRVVRRGGWRLKLYEHSLSLTLFALFLLSWLGHALAGRAHYNNDLAEHGVAPISLGRFISSSRFWFESLQNWQSEFLAVAAIVILSIWLREKGSPESKSVASAHSDTGG
jgi:membrane protein implicated in regulation of membrane protease activity